MTSTLHEPKKRHISDHQTWAQDTFKVSSLRPSSYFYNQDKNQVLCSLKKQAQERISIFKKIQARCYVFNQAQASKTRIKRFKHWARNPKYFEFKFYLLAGCKIETIVTLNYGSKIICVMANIIFLQFFNKSCRHQRYFVDIIGKKTEGFGKNIKLLARFVLLWKRGQVHFVYFKSKTRLRAESLSKN